MADPVARGQTLAAFFLRLEPGLWRDIVDSGLVPDPADPEARAEWEAFALHACVRGLPALGHRVVQRVHRARALGPEAARGHQPAHARVQRERLPLGARRSRSATSSTARSRATWPRAATTR